MDEKGVLMSFGDSDKYLRLQVVGFSPEGTPVTEIGNIPEIRAIMDDFKVLAEKHLGIEEE